MRRIMKHVQNLFALQSCPAGRALAATAQRAIAKHLGRFGDIPRPVPLADLRALQAEYDRRYGKPSSSAPDPLTGA